MQTVQFEIQFDPNKPPKKSSAGNGKWQIAAEFELNGKKFRTFLDIYEVKGKPEAEAKPVSVKVKAQ